jgi:hypothetical protein
MPSPYRSGRFESIPRADDLGLGLIRRPRRAVAVPLGPGGAGVTGWG